jgi:hypothetical protein
MARLYIHQRIQSLNALPPVAFLFAYKAPNRSNNILNV